jgi:hypothetical protein
MKNYQGCLRNPLISFLQMYRTLLVSKASITITGLLAIIFCPLQPKMNSGISRKESSPELSCISTKPEISGDIALQDIIPVAFEDQSL